MRMLNDLDNKLGVTGMQETRKMGLVYFWNFFLPICVRISYRTINSDSMRMLNSLDHELGVHINGGKIRKMELGYFYIFYIHLKIHVYLRLFKI